MVSKKLEYSFHTALTTFLLLKLASANSILGARNVSQTLAYLRASFQEESKFNKGECYMKHANFLIKTINLTTLGSVRLFPFHRSSSTR